MRERGKAVSNGAGGWLEDTHWIELTCGQKALDLVERRRTARP